MSTYVAAIVLLSTCKTRGHDQTAQSCVLVEISGYIFSKIYTRNNGGHLQHQLQKIAFKKLEK